MKKILPVIIVVAVLGGWLWYTKNPQTTSSPSSESTASGSQPTLGGAISTPAALSIKPNVANPPSSGSRSPSDAADDPDTEVEAADDVKPATETYTSADEALAAVLKGSKDFDDSILEQFTEPGEDCTWCNQFYTSVRDLVMNPNTPQDQKSYLAEVLAISGRVENIQTLAEAIKNAPSGTEADLYAEALELTMGKDDVTNYLGSQLNSTNDTLREAAVSAITNQGSKLAAELLAKHVQERGDADAYYSVGIGPGEFVPDEEALPLVQEYVQRRDQYSPAWAKALINSGLPGLRILFEQLEGSTNAESDNALLKDAIDHVNFEDGVKDLTETVIINNGNPRGVAFAKQIQEEFAQQVADESAATEP